MSETINDLFVYPEVNNVEWDKSGRVHDWRNHVGKRTIALWPTLTEDQRLALALDAADRASDEHWD